MEYRDRAAGWQHAKLSGHKNEDLVKGLLDNDKEYALAFLNRLGLASDLIKETRIGGLRETNVESVNGRKTKSKTDLKVFLKNGKKVNISIKKSLCGQVYFVRAGLFIDTFEKQFNRTIPQTVKRAINLFWAGADDACSIIERFSIKDRNYDLQYRHKSLNATTLKAYDEELYHALLSWFRDNIYAITKLCFSMGAAKNKEDWSDSIWYINLLDENDVDELFSIEDICRAAQGCAWDKTYYSSSNGGTTIQLPFGFVQWHQAQLQFHHNFLKIKEMSE